MADAPHVDMPVRVLDLDLPDLPETISRSKAFEALELLGISHQSVRAVEIGVRTVTVTHLVKQPGKPHIHEVKTEIPVKR